MKTVLVSIATVALIAILQGPRIEENSTAVGGALSGNVCCNSSGYTPFSCSSLNASCTGGTADISNISSGCNEIAHETGESESQDDCSGGPGCSLTTAAVSEGLCDPPSKPGGPNGQAGGGGN